MSDGPPGAVEYVFKPFLRDNIARGPQYCSRSVLTWETKQ